MTSTPAAPTALDDDGQDAFESEFTDGPPAMGVVILVSVFMLGLWIGGALAFLARPADIAAALGWLR